MATSFEWEPCPRCAEEGNELCPACRTSFARAELTSLAQHLADVGLTYEGAHHSARAIAGAGSRLDVETDRLLSLMADVVDEVNRALGTKVEGRHDVKPWHLRQARPSRQ